MRRIFFYSMPLLIAFLLTACGDKNDLVPPVEGNEARTEDKTFALTTAQNDSYLPRVRFVLDRRKSAADDEANINPADEAAIEAAILSANFSREELAGYLQTFHPIGFPRLLYYVTLWDYARVGELTNAEPLTGERYRDVDRGLREVEGVFALPLDSLTDAERTSIIRALHYERRRIILNANATEEDFNAYDRSNA